ncbi:G-protein coupled receptor Mth2-like isoform X2 [Euwallacea fornicatus]|uniref:G-protein coupled receptor Mth2-like isoform X2 n=1 Tax=Euwallacea fornicatus TaxID=995702 RepID=UPI00338F32CD
MDLPGCKTYFLLLLISAVSSENCETTVDITDGTRDGDSIVKDEVVYTPIDYFLECNVVKGCVCQVTKCLRRCCDNNETLISTDAGTAECRAGDREIDVVRDLETVIGQNISQFHIITVPIRDVCTAEGEYRTFVHDDVQIEASGDLDWNGEQYQFDKYCASNYEGHLGILLCVIPDRSVNQLVYCVGMIISMPFLLVTFVVYALLPDRNLHQKALMFYVLTLLIAYILLVTINLSNEILMPWCSVIAYATIFSFMSSFFWMNVICFDIWYTFSGGRGFVGSKRSTERRRLIYYSLYALGGPLLILGLIGLMQTVLPDDSNHNPNIGVKMCFLNDGWANLWYFYLEAGILVLVNVIFFTLTALKIRKVKKETSMLNHNDSKRHSYEKDKQKFNLYIKLLFAMGVNWSMEVISWAINWRTANELQYIWYVTDTFNAIYGVFIFFIFVFKKKIWSLLQKRYYNFIGKPHLAHTVTTNQTRTSHYSSTNYSTADTQLTDTNGRPSPEEMGLRTLS